MCKNRPEFANSSKCFQLEWHHAHRETRARHTKQLISNAKHTEYSSQVSSEDTGTGSKCYKMRKRIRSVWASKAGEGSWWRLKLSQVLTEVGLLKRKEIFGAEYIPCVCVYGFIHTCAQMHLCINEINMYPSKVYVRYLFLRYPQDSRLRILQW